MPLSYLEIQSLLNHTDLEGLPRLSISILRNIMLEPIEPYLRYYAYQISFNARIRFGEYDNIFQEAGGGWPGLINNDTDCVLIFMHIKTLSDTLSSGFTGLDSNQVKTEVERIQKQVQSVLDGIRKQTNAIILWHSFELPLYPAQGIWDSQIEDGQLSVVAELNNSLRKNLRAVPNAYMVNLNLCLNRIGSDQFYDLRYWNIGRAPYSRAGLQEIAFEDFKFLRALTSKNKKCLVLDCDNVLWGGIIGEDGVSGIKLAKSYPGSAYREFQQEIMNLYNRGILIALCSKNNEDDVWDVFNNHPDMVLRRKHIVAARINWEDKATNLRQIAADLNIGLDSIVFMDDSEFEVNLIRQTLPEVEVVHLPKEKTVEYGKILASCGLFETLTISAEDKKRGVMYHNDMKRQQLHLQIPDMITYYETLEMVVDICSADEFAVPRIAQLTQKTNQFNLTTRRYNDADIKHYVEDCFTDVIYIKLRDKFGDSGIVGTCIVKYADQKAMIDAFLLSCRVLGRGLEDIFILYVLRKAKQRGCNIVEGEYIQTRKNNQVEFFYINKGFKEITCGKDQNRRIFHYDLTQEIKADPAFFKEIHSDMNTESIS
jgi:FkbH-like protein